MIVALSSEAAPRQSLEQLADDAARRGITALHIVFDDAEQLARAQPLDVQVVGISVNAADGLTPEAAAAASLRLRAPFTLTAASPGWRAAFEAAGGSLLITSDVNAARQNVAVALAPLLLAGDAVQHITLRGAGPEGVYHEGCGIGSLMARLAVLGYHGALVLAPSSKSALPLWRTWLQAGRSWGCGSKQADHSLVQLV